MESCSDNESDFSTTQTATHRKKKPGRRALVEEPKNKRIAQNRNAQRAFRERKEAYLHGLERKVEEQAARIEDLERENQILRSSFEVQPCAAALAQINFSDTTTTTTTTSTCIQQSPFQSPVSNHIFNLSPSLTLVGESPHIQQSIHHHEPQQHQQHHAGKQTEDLFSFLNSPSSSLQPSSTTSTTLLPNSYSNLEAILLGIKTDPPQDADINSSNRAATSSSTSSSSVPELKATMDMLDHAESTHAYLDPNPVRLPQLTIIQTALKQLPSLHHKTHLIDELCMRFVDFTNKCRCQGLPYVDGVPVVTEEHRSLLRLKDEIVECCGGGSGGGDRRKCEEIMDIARRNHRVHYERLVRHWERALNKF
ncbi:hypothetical protein BDR26DRAFT_852475 [Obelidium mucronatum]|nr:hypothetical protein BDR26DRAFT_852475 [Obelidium mucronatum]